MFCEFSLHSHQDANDFEVSANVPFVSIVLNSFQKDFDASFVSIVLNSFQKDFDAFTRFFLMNRMCYRNRRFYIQLCNNTAFKLFFKESMKSLLINNVCFTQFFKQIMNVVTVTKRSVYYQCYGNVQVSLSVMTYNYILLERDNFKENEENCDGSDVGTESC